MIRFAILCFVYVVVAAITGVAAAQVQAQPIEEASIRAAATKSLQLVQKAQAAWYDNATCISCHHQILPAIAQSIARDRHVDFNVAAARDVTLKSFSYLRDLDAIVQGYNYIDEVDEAWKLIAAHAAGVPASLATSAAAGFLASAQRPEGSWYTLDGRPPQSFSRFTTTAVCAQAVRLYLPDELRDERQAILGRAREWLLKSEPRSTEDRTFQLLGLLWTGADHESRAAPSRQLLAMQNHDDGGWSQLPRLGSDAYSTGEVLYALHEGAGLPTTDPAYQRGLQFLLKNQKADGSWRIDSRLDPAANPSPGYFDAVFPHEQNHQYSSLTGTNWATVALLLAIPSQSEGEPSPAPMDLAPAEKAEWIGVALNGSVAELEQALKAGLNPNAATTRSTTALMLAARDPRKVELLIKHGAHVNARSTSGYTPLIVAARYHGNAEAVRLLLKDGANVQTVKRDQGKCDASALFFAAACGDVQMAEELLNAGARFDETMLVIELFHMTPLVAAVRRGDNAMVELLLKRNADPNEPGGGGLSPLIQATLFNHPETVQLLIKGGAKFNHQDSEGLSPLAYAAYTDWGDTAVVERLLLAGVDRNAKDKQGQTALDVARQRGNLDIAKLLEGKEPPQTVGNSPRK